AGACRLRRFGGRGLRGNGCHPPKKGFSRDESLERVRAEPAGLPAGRQGKQGVAEGTECWILRSDRRAGGQRRWLEVDAHPPYKQGGCGSDGETVESPHAGACRLRRFGNAACMNCCTLSAFRRACQTVL